MAHVLVDLHPRSKPPSEAFRNEHRVFVLNKALRDGFPHHRDERLILDRDARERASVGGFDLSAKRM